VSGAAPAAASAEPRRSWALHLARNVALWALPAAVLWMAFTPYYNLFLSVAAERLARLTESPAVTSIALSDGQDALITRSDTRAHGRLPYAVHVSDIHFPLVLLLALFLSTPGVPWSRRLADLGTSFVVLACFHVIDFLFWVKFAYATQLGPWSVEHYGAFARNFWGLGKHLLDLPVKLALPFALWCVYYLGRLTGTEDDQTEPTPAASHPPRRSRPRRRRR
jgi:hypothetical protein